MPIIGIFLYVSWIILFLLLEVVSTPPGPNLGVGVRRLILEILYVFLRLNASLRLDLEPD
jgi:hypothetical protein